MASSSSEREAHLAEVFLGLGHLTHLVEDASVPSHSRNTFHPSDGFEGFVEEHQFDLFGPAVSVIQSDPSLVPPDTIFSLSSLRRKFSSNADLENFPVIALIDYGDYNGSNPEVTLRQPIGIAEYSNAGFANDSRRAIFRGEFPFPKLTEMDKTFVIETDQFGSNIQYLRKVSTGVAPLGIHEIRHFAATDYFIDDL